MVEETSQISERIKSMKQSDFSITLENIVQELLDDLKITLTEEQIQCLLLLRTRVSNSDNIKSFNQKKIIDEVFPIQNNEALLQVIVGLLDKTMFEESNLRIILPAFLAKEELEEIILPFQDKQNIITLLEKTLKSNGLSSIEEKVVKEKVEDKLLKELVEIFKIGGNSSSKVILDYLSSIEELDIEQDFEKISFLARLVIDTGDNKSIMAIYELLLNYASKLESYDLISKIGKIFTGIDKNLVIQYDLDKAIYNIENTGVQETLVLTLISNLKSNLLLEDKGLKIKSSSAILLKSIVEMVYYKKLYLNTDYIIEEITKIISKDIFNNISIKENEEIYITGYNLGLAILVLDSMKPRTIGTLDLQRAEELCMAVFTPLEGPVGMNN